MTTNNLPVIPRIVRRSALERARLASCVAWVLGVVSVFLALGSAAIALHSWVVHETPGAAAPAARR